MYTSCFSLTKGQYGYSECRFCAASLASAKCVSSSLEQKSLVSFQGQAFFVFFFLFLLFFFSSSTSDLDWRRFAFALQLQFLYFFYSSTTCFQSHRLGIAFQHYSVKAPAPPSSTKMFIGQGLLAICPLQRQDTSNPHKVDGMHKK